MRPRRRYTSLHLHQVHNTPPRYIFTLIQSLIFIDVTVSNFFSYHEYITVPARCLQSTLCSPSVSQRECQDLAEFVRQVLGPYSVNVTTAARLCSASLCQGKGRCIRQNPESSAYLHLPPPSEVVEKVTEKVRECCCFLK